MISQQIVGVLLDMHKKPYRWEYGIKKQTIQSQQETKNFDNHLAPTIHDFGVLLDIHKKM
jgi:hypothetical protein